MSGGNSGIDPYHQADPPKRNNAKKELLPKSYRNAVKPKRIDVLPNGRSVFVYDCAHCGKEIKIDARKTARHALCDRKCRNEWQKYSRQPRIVSPEERELFSRRMKKVWADPAQRTMRTKAIQKVMQTPEYREKHKRAAQEVASRPEWKEKQSKAHKGRKRPPEVGRKISAAKMGHPVSDETRGKLAKAFEGENSSFWRGGVAGEKANFYASWQWKRQTERVKVRDSGICQGCGWTEEEVNAIRQKLTGHHVIPLEDYFGSWYQYPDDMVKTLCTTCHGATEYQESEEKWPTNGRGEEARLDRLSNPESKQTFLNDTE